MSFIDAAAGSGSVKVRAPKVWLSINGSMIPCLAGKVTRNAVQKADTFSVEMSVTESAKFGMGLADWADYQPVEVQVIMAVAADGSDKTSMITGMIDEPRINWEEMTISASGRDLSSKLIERRYSKKYQNQKSSDIAASIAKDVNLGSSVVDTGDNAGKLYDQDTVHMVLNRTYFEVLSDLAGREGYRWYVDGSTLYFEPKGQDTDVYSVTWTPPGGSSAYGVANVTDLKTFRNMTAAAPQTHHGPSWHHRDKKLYDSEAKSGGVGDEITVEHHYNGRNQDQADKITKSRLKDAIRHDCNVIVKAPADLSINARMKMQLGGTGTIYDQLYDIDVTEFETAWGQGADMTVTGKIAKSGRDGTDDTGATSITSADAGTATPAPSADNTAHATAGGIGSDAAASSGYVYPGGLGTGGALGGGGIGHA